MLSLGEETTVKINGKTLIIGRLELTPLKRFRDYIAKQIGDPYALVERFIDKMPQEWVTAELDKAKAITEQLESFSIACPLFKRFSAAETGMCILVHQLLLINHPDATEDDAFRLLEHMGREAMAETLARSHGEIPLKNGPLSSEPATAPTR
jgi:hypothetical protein